MIAACGVQSGLDTPKRQYMLVTRPCVCAHMLVQALHCSYLATCVVGTPIQRFSAGLLAHYTVGGVTSCGMCC